MKVQITSVTVGLGASEGTISGQGVNDDGSPTGGSISMPLDAAEAKKFSVGQVCEVTIAKPAAK